MSEGSLGGVCVCSIVIRQSSTGYVMRMWIRVRVLRERSIEVVDALS